MLGFNFASLHLLPSMSLLLWPNTALQNKIYQCLREFHLQLKELI